MNDGGGQRLDLMTAGAGAPLSEMEQRLLNEFQRDFPLCPAPYAKLASALGVRTETVLDALRRHRHHGAVSRVGPVFRPNHAGASTLAAMSVPMQVLESVAEIVSAFPEVNHSYEREHRFNLWFVVTAADPDSVAAALDRIEAAAGYEILRLPLLDDYHIDLGFEIKWSRCPS